jgi:lysophospholipase L1-like esterase
VWPDLAAVILHVAMAATPAADAAATGFLALGDSYTIGEGVADGERWPQQLAALLRERGVAIAAPEIVARTGWTTDELAAAMDARTFHPPYALITLLIGVNNQYRGRDLDNYRREFHALLERAIALAGQRPQRVIVVSIPDWGVTRFGRASGRDAARIAHELDAYNAANTEIAKMLHTDYASVTDLSRVGADHTEMLVGDGLHPSAAMYRQWAQRILPRAVAALSSP